MLLWSFCHLLQPLDVGPDLGCAFTVKMLGVAAHMLIIGFPLVEMPKKQVMISTPAFT